MVLDRLWRNDRRAELRQFRMSVPILLVAAAVVVAGVLIGRELRAGRREAATQRLLMTFAAAVVEVQRDARVLVTWHPIAQAARRLFPDAFTRLDAATGGTFPFSKEQIQAAHARWTADWLAWEMAHDAECKLKVSAIEEEAVRRGETGSSTVRARVEAVEREKLERYQRRYEDYIRTAKALAALDGPR